MSPRFSERVDDAFATLRRAREQLERREAVFPGNALNELAAAIRHVLEAVKLRE